MNHAETFDRLKNVVVQGDVNEVLDYVPDESIHLSLTSPPYFNARDYSFWTTYNDYLDFMKSVLLKVCRVTKEGRFLVINTSPIIMPRPHRQCSSKRYGIPFDIHSILMTMNWDFVDDIIWQKPQASSKDRVSNFNVNRKPLTYKANSCTEYVMVYRKKTPRLIDWNLKQYSDEVVAESLVDDSFERSNVWQIPPTHNKTHSAVFPLELAKQVLKLYSFKNDLVLDPFAGSGTTGAAAVVLNRNYLLAEQNEGYADGIDRRLGGWFSPHRRYSLDEFKAL